jgi:hypothetical protein
MSFSKLIDELRLNINHNRDILQTVLKQNPNIAYAKINQIANFTGSRHNVNLQIHFPDSKKIAAIDLYGKENIGVVIDKFRKTFPIPREKIKQKAIEIIGNVQPQDAYMYEGKEGVKLILEDGTIEILPGSIHLWCKIDEKIKSYGNWLMQEVYFLQF